MARLGTVMLPGVRLAATVATGTAILVWKLGVLLGTGSDLLCSD